MPIYPGSETRAEPYALNACNMVQGQPVAMRGGCASNKKPGTWPGFLSGGVLLQAAVALGEALGGHGAIGLVFAEAVGQHGATGQ